jgi:hypothetical protein
MATRHAPTQPGPDPAAGKLVEYEEFIESQLRKTRSRVRGVDIAAAVMVLVAATIGFFLLVAVVDHWLITGGLDFWGRLVLLAGYLTAAIYWTVTEIVPLLVKRINPLYAAQTIERSRPTLKNTLLNFLLFRANPAGVHQKVMAAIEEQAATNLAGAEVDSAVDRSRLIRLGYVLVAVMIVCAAYMLLSPKNLLQTVGRVVMPWADISAPTRTTIDEVSPGDAEAFRGQQIAVKARVAGLPDDSRVMLYYTTADRQIVDRAVEMSRPADDYRHVALLPAGDSALQQTLSYTIRAGDAVTRPYTITVVAAPTIVVRAVEYDYPSYTGLLKQRVEHQGDLKAIEGTRVTLEALANQDIDAAHVDFDCDDALDLRMQAREQTARGTFTLSLGDDRQTPEHGSYQVVFKNSAGERNPQPVRHQIEVTRDIAPEIQFVAPKREEIDLPADAAVDLEVVAGDPDFALAGVTLSAVKGQAPLFEEKLLDETWRGQFVKKFRFLPAKLGLKPGDVVDYWAAAVDNKDPQPNRAQTDKRRIRITSPSGREGDQDQVARNDRRPDGQKQPDSDDAQPGDKNEPQDRSEPSDAKSAESESGEDESGQGEPAQDGQRGEGQPAGEKEKGTSGDQPGESQEGSGDAAEQGSGDAQSSPADEQQERHSVPNDGTNDGEAIERILKHRNEQAGDDQPPSDERDQQPRDERQAGQQGSSEQRGEDQGTEKQPAADDPSDREPGAEDQRPQDGPSPRDAKQQPGQPDGSPADKKDRQKSPDGMPPDGDQPGEPQAGEKSPGKSAAEKKPSGAANDPQSSDEEGQGQTGEKPTDRSQPRDQRDVEHTRGEGTDPNNAQGQKPGDEPQEKDPRRQATRDNNTRQDGTPQDPSTKGQGGQSKDDPTRHPDQKPKQDGQQRPDARGGDGEQEKGESGAGQSTNENKGSARPQETSTPRPKSKQPGAEEKEPMRDGPEQSPSTTKKESDSEGQEDGDRSGGGKRGGGQKANKPGTGGAGQNTAADEGAGRSDEAGEGETSDRAGGDRQSDDKTGQSGSEAGEGSRNKPSEGTHEKPGGDDAPQDSSESPSSQTPSGENNAGAGAQGGENPSDSQPGSRGPREQPWKPGTEKADEANLEYARQATNLALEHLKDQLRKEQPDQELLDRLGWSREDLEEFVKRWESMRAGAQAPDEQATSAKRELDETLRSLGLRPRATTLKSRGVDDRAQGYQESHRTTPPAEYSESFKAYTQGTARGGK